MYEDMALKLETDILENEVKWALENIANRSVGWWTVWIKMIEARMVWKESKAKKK